MVQQHFSLNSSLQIVVLAGGDSAERSVSLKSGAAVTAALRSAGHHVAEVDPATVDLQEYEWGETDAVFIALHGQFGEDGQVQQILQSAALPYTGSGPAVSRLAFSKSASKERFLQHNVPTPAYVLIHESDDRQRLQQHAAELGYPLVVKPDAQGSSLGVSIVSDPEELSQALSQCFEYDPFGLLERAVVGTEWTLGVLDQINLPLIQIGTEHTFFDFNAKYEDEATQYRFEFTLPEEVIQAIIQAGRQACDALGVRGVARVDVRLDEAGNPWVLEVNTIPGLTDHSLVPKAAARMGISFTELCERAIAACLPARQRTP